MIKRETVSLETSRGSFGRNETKIASHKAREAKRGSLATIETTTDEC